jgi:hypothetical protein
MNSGTIKTQERREEVLEAYRRTYGELPLGGLTLLSFDKKEVER